MSKSITPARQRNAISEGMALGLCMRERYRFRHDKLRVDLAFERAWRDWPYRQRFSQVDTDLRKGMGGSLVMTHANETKSTYVFFWDYHGPDLIIYGRTGDWETDNPEDVAYAVKMIDGDVPLAGWVRLADSFLEDFDRKYGK